tara:strand:- start:31 stop:534 length:504 start_codon:yes stop_codon:yes gene_type:complete
MKIYKNFIKKEYSNKINDEFLKPYFPWYYKEHQTASNDTSYMFHLFHDGTNVNSDYFHLVEPILKKLKIKNILNVRANLCLKRPSICSWHVDDLTENLKHKTAIYYVNTNNGCTLIRDYSDNGVSQIKKVKCEKNKIVIFDAIQKHKAKIQTNTDTRMVININYELL